MPPTVLPILVTSGILEFEGQETRRHFLSYLGVVARVQPATATQPGTLILAGGRVVRFDDRTQFTAGIPAIGDTVSVKGSGKHDGTDDARKVKVK